MLRVFLFTIFDPRIWQLKAGTHIQSDSPHQLPLEDLSYATLAALTLSLKGHATPARIKMTALDENVTNDASTLTLCQCLGDGPIPLPLALRYAVMLAEALRQIHDSGRSCGAVTPSNIAITDTGLELIDTPSQPSAVTPYTAPEILQGHPPDSRSDIFAFGAIVPHEMVTGLRAFAGDNADALAVSLTISAPPPTGIPAVDHLISNCIAKDPEVRCQRMQKVLLELKILAFAPPRPEGVSLQQGSGSCATCRNGATRSSHVCAPPDAPESHDRYAAGIG